MSNNAPYALSSVSGNPALAPRPLASWAEDPNNAKTLTLIAVLGGFVIAAGGLAAGKFLGGSGSGPTGGGPIAPAASSSAASAAPTSAAYASSAVPAATAAAGSGGCPAGMVFIGAGKAMMGLDDPEYKGWSPAHEVTLDPYCIDAYEVTAGDYKACADTNKCKTPPTVPDYPKPSSRSDDEHTKNRNALAELCTFGKPGLERHPINCVSWELADTYCKAQKKRLPTEAEWEYTARGSSGRKLPWGDDPGDHTFMNACGVECNTWETAHDLKPTDRIYEGDDGFFGTAPVGSFSNGKTFSGVYDLVGNVWEWTADWYDDYKAEPATNPKGPPTGDRKSMRGGGFNSGSQLSVKSSFRFGQVWTASAPAVGFRCAATP